MTKIEMLYAGKTINDLLQERSAKELIGEFNDYLNEIVVTGVKIEENLLGRQRYLDEKTTDLVLELIEYFGEEYSQEIILLLSEQEYTLLRRVCSKFNLFEYLVQQMKTIQELRDNKVGHLFFSVLDYSEEQVYGKKVYSSFGNRGTTYSGFINTLYSNPYGKNGVLGIHFQLKIETYCYDILNLGKDLGISEETLKKLENANKSTEFLMLPKHRKTARVKSMNSFEPRPTMDQKNEDDFKQALKDYVQELNQIISKDYPSFTVKHSEFFQSRTDVDTEYSITFEKKVAIDSNYESVRSDLIETIKTLNIMERKYFDFKYMHEDLVEFRKECAERSQPLFGV